MSSPIECSRCGKTAPPPAEVPYTGELGAEIVSKVCADCWAEWLNAEVMVINELRLNFMDPQAQDVLTKHMREYLSLDG